MKTLFVATMAAVALLAGPTWAQTSAAQWKTYDYPEFGFSVRLPTAPQVKDDTQREQGDVTYRDVTLVSVAERRAYMISVAMLVRGDGNRSRGSCEASFRAFPPSDKALWHRTFEVPGGAGLDTAKLYDDPSADVRAVRVHVVCADGWWHGLMVSGADAGALTDADAEQFVSSFRRLP